MFRSGIRPGRRTGNIRYIGEVAKPIASNGVICITAFISPYRADRKLVRKILPDGRFIEMYISAPIEVSEACSNEIKNLTGISAPDEAPEHPELELRTDLLGSEECVGGILDALGRICGIMAFHSGKTANGDSNKRSTINLAAKCARWQGCVQLCIEALQSLFTLESAKIPSSLCLCQTKKHRLSCRPFVPRDDSGSFSCS